MKETQPQVLESTSQWPQKILALAPNLNRPLNRPLMGCDTQQSRFSEAGKLMISICMNIRPDVQGIGLKLTYCRT
jgi:hypothetical protein